MNNEEQRLLVFVTGKQVGQLIKDTSVGAPDAHAKNYSLLLTEDGPLLSPLYDCASAYPYDLESGKWHTAMYIGSTNAFGELTQNDIKAYSETAQLPFETCQNIFANLAQGILDHCEEVFDRIDAEDSKELRERMLPRLKEHARKALAV